MESKNLEIEIDNLENLDMEGSNMEHNEEDVFSEDLESDSLDNKKPAKKKFAFLEALRENQLAQARQAFEKTLKENSELPIGKIIESLEYEDGDGFFMLEMFKEMSLRELSDLISGHSFILEDRPIQAESCNLIEKEEVDYFEMQDDGSYPDDGSDESEADGYDVEEIEPPPPKAKSTKKKNKKAKKPKPSKALGDAELDKEFQTEIIATLKALGAKGEDSALSKKEILAELGPDADAEAFAVNMKHLREQGRCDSIGKARGTKYFRVPRKKK